MKIYISKQGITEPIKNVIDDTEKELRNAKKFIISCPYGFKYSSNVRELRNEINDFIKELQYINNSLIKVERMYNGLFRETIRSIDYVKEQKIPTRTKLKDTI